MLSPQVQPNAAHLALASFEEDFPGAFLLVTQNIDHLHEQAGSIEVVHMHGELLKKRCQNCNYISEVNTQGGQSVEINLEPSATESGFVRKIHGPAGETLPQFLQQLRAGTAFE